MKKSKKERRTVTAEGLNNNKSGNSKNFSVGDNGDSRIKQAVEKDDNTESRVKQNVTNNGDLKSVQNRDVLYYAKLYLENGLNVIPIVFRDKKPALESWKEYQTKRVSEKEVEEWFNDNTEHNIGIICGKVSGNLAVMDFDDWELYTKWIEYLDNYPKLKDIILNTWIVGTGKGAHIYLRVDKVYHNAVRVVSKVDIRGDGGYVV